MGNVAEFIMIGATMTQVDTSSSLEHHQIVLWHWSLVTCCETVLDDFFMAQSNLLCFFPSLANGCLSSP
ncbi:hypothetical protein NC653_001542 [Populus alba x Populus x berolinensis]|uniref:Uncharacterized protein n=1 Tax=Populus alba x Populus x berolinensis TaxID=444605 RepID=A0AAD6RLR7_9ROSI|nr:hypothetical protein NC653_001542 [Populus alba x Populus x berolinensis]